MLFPEGTIRLSNSDSYHFLANEIFNLTGGDFYFGFSKGKSKFWANNHFQGGIIDLGDIGDVPLDSIDPPLQGYYRFGVEAILGHTYVSPAKEGEEGHYIIFRVIQLVDDQYVEIEYFYR